MSDTLYVDPIAYVDSRESTLTRRTALTKSILEYLDVLPDHESSPATRTSFAPSSPPALAPVIIAQHLNSWSEEPEKKIAILRSKVQSWDKPDVLENICKLLKVKPMLRLEATFTGLDPSVSVPIDMKSWKDMVPYITTLSVSV
ncbi:hypothetical protein FIBSPDRAFT_940377, partial [Athelia psychrophila]